MPLIYIIEDDEDIRELVLYALKAMVLKQKDLKVEGIYSKTLFLI